MERSRCQAVPPRPKRLSDPLDQRVRACLCGEGCRPSITPSSDNGPHDDHGEVLSCLDPGFLSTPCDEHLHMKPQESSDSDRESSPRIAETVDTIESLVQQNRGDPSLDRLRFDVTRAVDAFSDIRSDALVLRRYVAAFLRRSGYDAAICTTKWEKRGGLAGGSYEFIDVVIRDGAGDERRHFVEFEFRDEFRIARPTAEYQRVLQSLPRIWIAKGDEVKEVVRLMTGAAKASMRKQNMSVPPWRRNGYAEAKWLGPYCRTVNDGPPESAFVSMEGTETRRLIGFSRDSPFR